MQKTQKTQLHNFLRYIWVKKSHRAELTQRYHNAVSKMDFPKYHKHMQQTSGEKI